MHSQKPISILVSYIKQPETNSFRNLYAQCISDLGDQMIGFKECHIGDVLEIAKQMIAQGCKILLCTDTTAEYLQKKLNIEIYTIQPEGFDLIEAIAQMKHQQKIALLISQQHTNLNLYKEIFALELSQYSYDSYLSAKNIIQKLKQTGIQAIIGSPVAVELALMSGLDARLAIGQNALRNVMTQALQRLEKIQQQQHQLSLLTQVIDHLQEGIGFVSSHGDLQLSNQLLRQICQLDGQDEIKPIQSIFKQFDFLAAKQKNIYHQAIQFNGKKFVLQCKFLAQPQGYLITLQQQLQIEHNSRELNKISRHGQVRYQFEDFVSQNKQFNSLLILAKAYAKSDATVLIMGETGTGKEMMAQSLHAASARKDYPFIAINCASFPESLLESELFGYEEGAFTGARKQGKMGLIEQAHQGTVFLDEIGDMPLHLQTRLLRVLQEQQIQRLGALHSQKLNIRVIAATHHQLEHAVNTGDFRADLFYRLNTLRLSIPPLRQRLDDLALLIEAYYRPFELKISDLPETIQSAMYTHAWKGNIRELENILERLRMLIGLPFIEQEDFLYSQFPELFEASQSFLSASVSSDLKNLKAKTEYDVIQQVLTENKGNIEQTLAQLQISRTTLWRKLKQKNQQ